jgi:hypothetical protein
MLPYGRTGSESSLIKQQELKKDPKPSDGLRSFWQRGISAIMPLTSSLRGTPICEFSLSIMHQLFVGSNVPFPFKRVLSAF